VSLATIVLYFSRQYLSSIKDENSDRCFETILNAGIYYTIMTDWFVLIRIHWGFAEHWFYEKAHHKPNARLKIDLKNASGGL
jgi:hypothetical protein